MLNAAGANRRVSLLLTAAKLVRLDADAAVLSLSPQDRTLARSMERDLLAVLAAGLGRPVRVEFDAEPEPEKAAPSEPEQPRTPIDQHPMVKQAIELFGGRIISVQPRPKAD